MPDVLIYADTFRSPELRHEVPLGVPDPFLYASATARGTSSIGSMEIPRLAELGGFELHPLEEFGVDELLAAAASRPRSCADELVRARRHGRSASTRRSCPATFPLRLADHLRADGVELTPDRDFFDARRRAKRRPSSPGSAARSARPRPAWTPRATCLRRAAANGDGARASTASR